MPSRRENPVCYEPFAALQRGTPLFPGTVSFVPYVSLGLALLNRLFSQLHQLITGDAAGLSISPFGTLGFFVPP